MADDQQTCLTLLGRYICIPILFTFSIYPIVLACILVCTPECTCAMWLSTFNHHCSCMLSAPLACSGSPPRMLSIYPVSHWLAMNPWTHPVTFQVLSVMTPNYCINTLPTMDIRTYVWMYICMHTYVHPSIGFRIMCKAVGLESPFRCTMPWWRSLYICTYTLKNYVMSIVQGTSSLLWGPAEGWSSEGMRSRRWLIVILSSLVKSVDRESD